MKNYRTTNFYLACYLQCKGISLVKIDKSDGKKFIFELELMDKTLEFEEEFNFGEPLISARDFINYIKQTKEIMYNS